MSAAIPSFDLYAELGVHESASPEAIEAAYRALIKQHHPDRAGQSGVERSKRLNIAQAWLRDPGRRADYDRARQEQILAETPVRPGAASARGTSNAPGTPNDDWRP